MGKNSGNLSSALSLKAGQSVSGVSSSAAKKPEIKNTNDREQGQGMNQAERKQSSKKPVKVSSGLQGRLQRAAMKSAIIPEITKKEEVQPAIEVSNQEISSAAKLVEAGTKAEPLSDLAQAVQEAKKIIPKITNAPPKEIIPVKGHSKLQQRIDAARRLDPREVVQNENTTEPPSLSTSGISSSSSTSAKQRAKFQQIYDRITVDGSNPSDSPSPSSYSPCSSPDFGSANEFSSNPPSVYSGVMPTVHLVPEVQQQALRFSYTCLQGIAAQALAKLTPQQQIELQHLTSFEPKYVPELFQNFINYWKIQGVPLNVDAVDTFMMTRGFQVVPVVLVNQY